MKSLILIIATLIAFTANAQYIRSNGGSNITTDDINMRAERLTKQCLNLHLAAVGCEVTGVLLVTIDAAQSVRSGMSGSAQSNGGSGLATVGSLLILGGGVCGIIEWVKVGQAHNILSLGNNRVSFNSNRNGIGLVYNF